MVMSAFWSWKCGNDDDDDLLVRVGIVPVALEIAVTLFGVFLAHALLTRSRTLKHSCFQHKLWAVHKGREIPRDMLAAKFFQNPHGLWVSCFDLS